MATHVIPIGELTEHARRPDCPCEPYAEWVTRSDGTGRWRVVHKAIVRDPTPSPMP